MKRWRGVGLVALVLAVAAVAFAAGRSDHRHSPAGPRVAHFKLNAKREAKLTAKRAGKARPRRHKAKNTRVKGPLGNTVLHGPADGSLHIAGRRILDSRDKPFLIHSVQIRGMGAGSGSATPDACGAAWSAPDPTQADAVATVGFDAIYYSISWQDLEPTAPSTTGGTLVHHWNTAWLAALERSVAGFTRRHVRVILAMNHYQWSSAFRNFRTGGGRALCEGSGIPAWLYPHTPVGTTPSAARCAFLADTGSASVPELPQQGLAAALGEIAHVFRSNRYVVALDPLSEPGFGGNRSACGAPDDGFVRFVERAAAAIHAQTPRLLVIAEDGTYSHLAHVGTIIPRAPRARGVVYAFEQYPKKWDDLQQPRAALARAKRLGLPALIYAFDAYRGGYPAARRSDPQWQANTRELLAFARANGIGWNFWALMHGAGSYLVGGVRKTPRADLLGVFRPDLR